MFENTILNCLFLDPYTMMMFVVSLSEVDKTFTLISEIKIVESETTADCRNSNHL